MTPNGIESEEWPDLTHEMMGFSKAVEDKMKAKAEAKGVKWGELGIK